MELDGSDTPLHCSARLELSRETLAPVCAPPVVCEQHEWGWGGGAPWTSLGDLEWNSIE